MVYDVANSVLETIISVLPTSPFTRFINALNSMPYLGYLNWFLPISQMIAIGEAWLVSIALFYLYSIILRWVKAIS